MSDDIYEEIEKEWRSCYADAHREPPTRREFPDVCAQQESANRDKALSGLQPWLGIFDFGVEWLAYVHFALSKEEDIGPQETDCRVPWSLIGAAVSFGLSVRTLCMSGFDTPARALLRSYVESLLLCLAVLHDRALAKDFEDADDDAKVKTFWHTAASPKNLHSRIMQIERQAGLQDDVVEFMAAWRRQEYEVLSQSAHLSYLAACLTACPPVLGDEKTHRVGILGQASQSSLRTLYYAAGANWHFSRFSFNALLGHTASDFSS